MTKLFSHLLWLGAGTATEPANILDSAEKATLIEAREAACQKLQKQYAQTDISIQQKLVTAHGEKCDFTEYNITEYSAVQPISGLKKIFPGLKAIHKETRNSVRIDEIINDLSLNNNNLLIIDLIDSALPLLKTIAENKQLMLFSKLYIQTSIEPLYKDAATANDVINFLQQHGFIVQQSNHNDPDLPCLVFNINPLWHQLHQTLQDKSELEMTLTNITQQLSESQRHNQQAEHSKNEFLAKIDTLKQQLAAEQLRATQAESDNAENINFIKLLENKVAESAQNISELNTSNLLLQHEVETNNEKAFQSQIENISKQLQRKSMQIKEQQEQLNELILVRKSLELENKKYKAKLESCAEQLSRADAQYQLIKDLILSRGLKGNENDQ